MCVCVVTLQVHLLPFSEHLLTAHTSGTGRMVLFISSLRHKAQCKELNTKTPCVVLLEENNQRWGGVMTQSHSPHPGVLFPDTTARRQRTNPSFTKAWWCYTVYSFRTTFQERSLWDVPCLKYNAEYWKPRTYRTKYTIIHIIRNNFFCERSC